MDSFFFWTSIPTFLFQKMPDIWKRKAGRSHKNFNMQFSPQTKVWLESFNSLKSTSELSFALSIELDKFYSKEHKFSMFVPLTFFFFFT